MTMIIKGIYLLVGIDCISLKLLNITLCFRNNEFVNDFEAMLAKRREDGTKRRKRRDIDIINDNDDIIDQLIQDMRAAAEV